LHSNPIRVTAEVENGDNACCLACIAVVNAEWEAFGEHSLAGELDRMDSVVERQTLDVSQQ